MARRRFLLIPGLLAVIALTLSPQGAFASVYGDTDPIEGDVGLIGEQTTPGTPGGEGADPGDPGSPGEGGGGEAAPPWDDPDGILDWCDGCALTPPQPGDPTPAEPADPLPPVTIVDIERFKPDRPGGLSEPDGWGLVGRPVNFVLTAEPHIITGELFGRPAQVRFTPAAFRIDTPAGTLVESAEPGATWAELGLPEFADTPTSHVFDERGIHTITPTVVYTAEYRYAGSDWTPITGTLPIPGDTRELRIITIDTVLIPNPRP